MFKQLRYPIIQAPMAGGIATPALAIAVSQNGGLGFLAAGYKSADVLETEIQQCIEAKIPFGVNIFVPTNEHYDDKALHIYKEKLEQDFSMKLPLPSWSDDAWQEKLSLLETYKVPYVSFTFGCPDKSLIEKLQNVGCRVIVTVTTLEESLLAQQAGATAICLQGIEAGGHRGSFQNVELNHSLSLASLIKLVKEVVDIPIIAAGGIMTGQQIRHLLEAGATAVQLGTAFICCAESGANDIYKQALIGGNFQQTVLTRAFTGRFARGLENEFTKQYEQYTTSAYPALHYMTQPIRKDALENKNPQAMSLWAGTGFKQIRAMPVQQFMQTIAAEATFQ